MWDSIIINPMINALLWLYQILGNNFVFAIAVFTLLIRGATWPLSLKQQKTSLRMQEMQPQIQAIQKKHKDNPAKMQEEFQAIGYNPAESFAGCLPLLLQFPVLIGLYRSILLLLGSTPLSLYQLSQRVYGTIDLANMLPLDNKFLWLNLAQPDPFYVLTALVFISSYAQQKLLAPRKAKNQDAKKKSDQEDAMASMTQSMQYTMPMMIAFWSLIMPSGLSVYWVLGNVIGIVQGYLTRKALPPPDAKESKSKIVDQISEVNSLDSGSKKQKKRKKKNK